MQRDVGSPPSTKATRAQATYHHINSYLECRVSICQNVTFTLCSIPTLYDFLITRHNPLVDEIRRLDVSFVLPTKLYPGNADLPTNPEEVWHKPEIDLWASLRERIGTMRSLLESRIWIDCFDERCFLLLLQAPIYFSIPPEVQSRVLFNLPVRDNQSLEHLQRRGIQITRRDKPEFHGDVMGRGQVTRGPWVPYWMGSLMAQPRPRVILIRR